MSYTDEQVQLAVDHVVSRFGHNFPAVFHVAKRLKNENESLPDLTQFGGAATLRANVEENTTAKDVREADKHANNIVKMWNAATRNEEAGDSSGDKIRKMFEGFSGLGAGAGDTQGLQKKLSSAKEELNKLKDQENPNEYAISNAEREVKRLTDKINSTMMEPIVNEADKEENKRTCAFIVALGQYAVAPDVYEAILLGQK